MSGNRLVTKPADGVVIFTGNVNLPQRHIPVDVDTSLTVKSQISWLSVIGSDDLTANIILLNIRQSLGRFKPQLKQSGGLSHSEPLHQTLAVPRLAHVNHRGAVGVSRRESGVAGVRSQERQTAAAARRRRRGGGGACGRPRALFSFHSALAASLTHLRRAAARKVTRRRSRLPGGGGSGADAATCGAARSSAHVSSARARRDEETGGD